MAVKEGNVRINITFTKRQEEWLKKTAKKFNWSISRLVRYLLNNNITKLANYLTKDEFTKLREIARTNWVFEEDEIDEILIR